MGEFEELAEEYEKRAASCLSEADAALSADRRLWEATALEFMRLGGNILALQRRCGLGC
jgi:hypothetical protein